MSQPSRRKQLPLTMPSLLQPIEPKPRPAPSPAQSETDPGYYRSDGTFVTLHEHSPSNASPTADRHDST
jgi:hypothetical protein